MSVLDRIEEANRLDTGGLVPFSVEGRDAGLADASFAERLCDWPDVFTMDAGHLTLAPGLADAAERSAAVAPVLAALREQGVIAGWRDELYPVVDAFGDAPLLEIERAAATLFGIKTFAVNLNGFVKTGDGVAIWLQHRAKSKPISPDKLDVLVSGGQPTGISPFDNLVKECHEEAGIPAGLARSATDAGWISFRARRPDGVHHGHYFNYDLELPADFEPVNRDEEVEAFYLWPVKKVMEVVAESTLLAFDSAVVVIDFLIRHGYIGADHPDFDDIRSGLRP